jgi:hypothetical protein
MPFRLIDQGWQNVFDSAVNGRHPELRIVCPFIKKGVAQRLLDLGKPKALRVITRFHLGDFYDGVSDTVALGLLLKHGAQVRGVSGLHAKMYLFGSARVIVTSANLTSAALTRNHEFGFEADGPAIVGPCAAYFNALWDKAGDDLTPERLAGWEALLTAARARGTCPTKPAGLTDEGVDAGIPADPITPPPLVDEAPQAFVKFFGTNTRRLEWSTAVLEEVDRSGSHWACTYPKGKRPRMVKDGAVMFMARMVKDPTDMLIFGRAVGQRHVPGRDDATAADIDYRAWKKDWPHYIRVHHGEFVAGTLANGVSLNALMTALGPDSFAVTQRHAARGRGNTNPRRAYLQQAAVELTAEGFAWLNHELESAFTRYGKLAPADLAALDHPSSPVLAAAGATS